MRIAVVNWASYLVGGAEAYVKSLLPVLLANGHEVAFLHGDACATTERSLSDGVDIPAWRFDETCPEIALGRLETWRPDLVYMHSQNSQILEDALLARFPVVLFAHNYYGTCATGTKTFSFPVVEPCTRRFGPMCLALHYTRRCGGLNPVTAIQTYRRQSARHKNLPRYSAVLVASRHMEAEFRNHGVSPERLHCTPLPLTNASPDQEPPSPRAPQGRVLMVGRLTKDKGAEHLLRALPIAVKKLGRPLQLTVAGRGPERDRLELLARRLALNVTFPGWVDAATRNALMREADVLVMPSLWPEPFGLVGLEAGCVGLPTVAYGSGGALEWLEPGKSGEIAWADPPRAENLADAIVRALADDRHYQELRRNAWKKTFQFTMTGHLAQVESIFEHALAGRSRHFSLSPRLSETATA